MTALATKFPADMWGANNRQRARLEHECKSHDADCTGCCGSANCVDCKRVRHGCLVEDNVCEDCWRKRVLA